MEIIFHIFTQYTSQIFVKENDFNKRLKTFSLQIGIIKYRKSFTARFLSLVVWLKTGKSLHMKTSVPNSVLFSR